MLSVHSGKKYDCSFWGYETKQKSNLKLHIQSKHEGFRFNCDECSFESSYKGEVKQHKKRVHEGIKHKCDQCEYEATQKASLNLHDSPNMMVYIIFVTIVNFVLPILVS